MAVELKPDDYWIQKSFRVDTGGRPIGRTESRITLFHRETGLIAGCQRHDSQHKNLEEAIRLLKKGLEIDSDSD